MLLCSEASVAAQHPTPDGYTVPFYTGNLSVYHFMRLYGTFTGSTPAGDWASPQRIEQLRRIGVSGDCDYLAWSVAEPRENQWDFSIYARNADLLRSAGFRYIVFCWVHFPPKWYMESEDYVPYQCAEHGEVLNQLSPWSPDVWQAYWRFYSALRQSLGDKVDIIRIAVPSDYGEIGYPAGMTSWLVPQKHAHPGFWCGDPYARQDFRAQMKSKFSTLKTLNARWGTRFALWDEVTYPELSEQGGAGLARQSGKGADRRRWLDFIEWYEGFWLRFCPRLVNAIRQLFPEKPTILSVGYASEDPRYGNDYSRIARMASKSGAALQSPSNVAYYAMKRVSTACRHYGVPYYTEPPGDVPPEKEVERIFYDASNGAQAYFEYPGNLDRALAKVNAYRHHLGGAKPVVDLAIFNPGVEHRLDCKDGFARQAYSLGESGRDRFDFDVLDETLVVDGALRDYRLLVYVQGSVTEKAALLEICRWIRSGGVLVTCDFGEAETVEGDRSIWQSLVPRLSVTTSDVLNGTSWDWDSVARRCVRKVGRGHVIKLPIKPDSTDTLCEAVALINFNLDRVVPGARNAPLIDGEADGILATLLPDRMLYYNATGREKLKKVVLRQADWSRFSRKPAEYCYELRLLPHSVEAITLR